MDLKDYRQEIDKIDDQLIDLFEKRMATAAAIAAYKKEHGLPVLDTGREIQKMRAILSKVPMEMRNYTSVLYSSLFELSRSYQSRQMEQYTDLSHKIADAIAGTPSLFPQSANVGVCGVEGAYAQIACESSSKCPSSSISTTLKGYFPPLKTAFASTAWCPLKTPPPAR